MKTAAPPDLTLGSPAWKQLIIQGAGQLNVAVTPDQAEQFAVHALELQRWNRKINLTRIENPLEVAVKHFVDAVIPARFIHDKASLLDVGSGGGFPGIPLKILIPSLNVILIDATRKKINFLNHVIRTLRLRNIKAQHVRVEDLARDERLHRFFDAITCRAFSDLTSFVTGSLPLVKPDGMWIALKGRDVENEVAFMDARAGVAADLALENDAGKRLSLSREVFQYRLPFLNDLRSLIVLRRTKDAIL